MVWEREEGPKCAQETRAYYIHSRGSRGMVNRLFISFPLVPLVCVGGNSPSACVIGKLPRGVE